MIKSFRLFALSVSTSAVLISAPYAADGLNDVDLGAHRFKVNMQASDITKGIDMATIAYHAFDAKKSETKRQTFEGDRARLQAQGKSIVHLQGETGLGFLSKKDDIAVMTQADNTVSIGFRGTKNGYDVLTDLNILRSNFYGFGTAHNGFKNTFESYKDQLFAQMDDAQKRGVTTVELSGHSMGGALAEITALALKARYLDMDIKVVSFNAPRIGDAELADSFGDLVGHTNHARLVKGRDAASSLNFGFLGNKHNGVEVRMPTKGWDPLRKHSMNNFRDGKAEDLFEKHQANPTKIDGMRTSVKKGINYLKETFEKVSTNAKKSFVSGFQALRKGVYNLFTR